MGCFVYNGLGDWSLKLDISGLLWVYGKGSFKYRFRFSLLKYLELVFSPNYIP